jgi:hypothetical protein
MKKKLWPVMLLSLLLALSLINGGGLVTADDPGNTTVIEAEDALVVAHGNWTYQAADGASNGGYLYSSGSPEDVLELRFQGTELAINYLEHPNFGTMAIEIDSTVVRTVSARAPESNLSAQQTVGYLPDMIHTARIYATEGVIAIDTFEAVGFAVVEDSAPVGPSTFVIEPTLDAYSQQPIFQWGEEPTATWYNLVASSSTGQAINEWYEVGNGVSCPSSQCSLKAPSSLSSLVIGATDQVTVDWSINYWDGSAVTNDYVDVSFVIDPVQNVATANTTAYDGRPTFTWDKTPNGDELYYNIYTIDANNAFVFDDWYEASAVCLGSNCSATATLEQAMSNGAYTFYMRTWGLEGYGPWSGPYTFTINAPAVPGEPTKISPLTGATETDDDVTFSWNEVADASGYYLYLVGPAGSTPAGQMTGMVGDEISCSAGTCEWTVNLSHNGSWSWYLAAFNAAGDGSWGSPPDYDVQSFTLDYQPGAPTNLNEELMNGDPTFSWDGNPEVEWWNVQVLDGATTVLNEWYEVDAINEMYCNAGSCDLIPPFMILSPKAYTWSVEGWVNNRLTGATSDTLDLSTLTAPPAPDENNFAIPEGTPVTDTDRPSYQWDPVSGATYYRLEIQDAANVVQYNEWLRARTICGSVCIARPEVYLIANGDYTMLVQAYGPGGISANSGTFTFNMNMPSLAGQTPTGLAQETPQEVNEVVTKWDHMGASWYYNEVLDGGSVLFSGWAPFPLCDLTGSPGCFLDLAPLVGELADGTYTWNLQGWSSAGAVSNTASETLTVAVPAAGDANLLTPADGAILIEDDITFEWDYVEYATYYGLTLVDLYSGDVISTTWYSSEDAGCENSVDTCSVEQTVPTGEYRWAVVTYSQGSGPADYTYTEGVTPDNVLYKLGY